MAFNTLTLAKTYAAYAKVGADDVYAYVRESVVYVKVNLGTWTAIRAIPHVGSISGDLIIQRISVHSNGLIVVILKLEDGVTNGVHVEIVHYTGTPALVSLLIEPMDDQTQLNGGLPIGSVWYDSTDLIHVMWNGFFRTMGSDFYTIKHQTFDAGTGAASAVTHILESASPTVGAWVFPTINKDALILRYVDGMAYLPVSTLSLGTANTIGTWITNATDESFVIKDTGATGKGLYYLRTYGSGSDTKMLLLTDGTNGSTTPTIIYDAIMSVGTRPLIAGCSLDSTGDILYLYVVLQDRTDTSIKTIQVYSISTTLSLATLRTPTLEREDDVTTDNLVTATYRGVARSLFVPPNSDIGTDVVMVGEFDLVTLHESIFVFPAGDPAKELTILVGTSGGNALDVFIATNDNRSLIIALSSLGGSSLVASINIFKAFNYISILNITHKLSGVTIYPDDETYKLTVGSTEFPLEWFTIRRIENLGVVVSTIICSVPEFFYSLANSLVGASFVLTSITYGQEQTLISDTLDFVKKGIESIELNCSTIETKGSATHIISKVQYVREINGVKTVRVVPKTTVKPGDFIKTDRLNILVDRSTLHISSTNNSFLEVS